MKTDGMYALTAEGGSRGVYRCEFCGVRFDRPSIRRRRERIDADGNREETVTEVCPICGYEFFEEEEEE